MIIASSFMPTRHGCEFLCKTGKRFSFFWQEKRVDTHGATRKIPVFYRYFSPPFHAHLLSLFASRQEKEDFFVENWNWRLFSCRCNISMNASMASLKNTFGTRRLTIPARLFYSMVCINIQFPVCAKTTKQKKTGKIGIHPKGGERSVVLFFCVIKKK